jgi:hypothetical protein
LAAAGRWEPRRSRRQDHALEAVGDWKSINVLVASPRPPPDPDNRCDFHFSIDVSNAYHLSLWAGCGSELQPVKRPAIVSNGPGQPNEVSGVDALLNGCTASTCRGGCDKDFRGIVIDGFVLRFAACRFGQKTAGSPLDSLVRAVARSRRAAGLGVPACQVRHWFVDLRADAACGHRPAGIAAAAVLDRAAARCWFRRRRRRWWMCWQLLLHGDAPGETCYHLGRDVHPVFDQDARFLFTVLELAASM